MTLCLLLNASETRQLSASRPVITADITRQLCFCGEVVAGAVAKRC